MSVLDDENKSLRKRIEKMREERNELQELVLEEIRIRTKIEGDLIRSEAEKAAILNSVPDTITLLNPELEYIWVNEAAARSLGKSPKEIVGRKCYGLWYNRDNKCDPCDIDTVLVKGQFYRNEYCSEDGIIWDILNVPIFDGNGEIESILRVSRDITHRKKMEDELKRSLSEKNAILDAIPDPISFKDTEYRFVWMNRALAHTLGMTVDEVKGKICYELARGRDVPCDQCLFMKTIATGKRTVGKQLFADGILMDVTIEPVHDSDGRLIGAIELSRAAIE